MDHPNIARIYDGGVTPSGQPFFVMELVKGVPLTEYCDAKRLTADSRLELFVSVCQAVQHAHQKGIIHRDLKPSNVLVTEVDGRPMPKVIDFGVAKATEQKLTDMSFSDVGAIVGTPAYMSPEQADPSSMDVDTRTDVYALGGMLYERLTGRPPFREAPAMATLRHVIEAEPVAPRRLKADIPLDLETICLKCLEKVPLARYPTVRALAEELGRFLKGEPIKRAAGECGPQGGELGLAPSRHPYSRGGAGDGHTGDWRLLPL